MPVTPRTRAINGGVDDDAVTDAVARPGRAITVNKIVGARRTRRRNSVARGEDDGAVAVRSARDLAILERTVRVAKTALDRRIPAVLHRNTRRAKTRVRVTNELAVGLHAANGGEVVQLVLGDDGHRRPPQRFAR